MQVSGLRLRNFICGGERNIAPSFITAISIWAEEHKWDQLHVASEPIGPMPGYLSACGFSDQRLVSVSQLKYVDRTQITQLKKDTHFSNNISFDMWLHPKTEVWFGYNNAKDIYQLLIMSFPDRIPTLKEIEWVYILTFRNNSIGYVSPRRDNNKLTFKDYCYIKNTCPHLHEWLHTFDTTYTQEIEDIRAILDSIALNNYFSDAAVEYMIQKSTSGLRVKNNTALDAEIDTKMDTYLQYIEDLFKLRIAHPCAVECGFVQKDKFTSVTDTMKDIMRYIRIRNAHRTNIETMIRIIFK